MFLIRQFWEVDSGTGDNSRTVDEAEGVGFNLLSMRAGVISGVLNDFAWRTLIGLVSLN